MTTIIIIVVVALVFFVSICVVTFMVWKRESEMRTDSIKAIELKLEKLGSKLSEDSRVEEIEHEISELKEPRKRESIFGHNHSHKSIDPFSWMRTEESDSLAESPEFESQSEVMNKIMADSVRSQDETEISWDEHELMSEPEISKLTGNSSNQINAESIQLNQTHDYGDYEENAITINSNDPNSNWTTNCSNDRNNDEKTDYSDVNVSQDEEEQIYAEIDLDFEEIRNLVSEIKLPEISEEETNQESTPKVDTPVIDNSDDRFTEVMKAPLTHDVGRSGRKYTAQELETLIKE